MADILIINGTDNKGFKDDFFTPVTAPLVSEIRIGNTVKKQDANTLNVLLGGMEKPVPRIDGQKLPVKFHNIKVSEGSISAGALEGRAFIDAFDLKESIGYNVQNFDYSRETMLRYANLVKVNPNLSPLAEDIEKTQASVNAYINGYLPNHRLIPLFTGSSMKKTVPVLDNGTHTYCYQGGWARGEDYADITTSNVDGDTVRNHYRVINGTAGTPFSTEDINSLAESIRSTDLFGQGNGTMEAGVEIVALCHPSLISTIIKLSNDTANKDRVIFDGKVKATELLGVYFVPIQTFHKDFTVMYDASYSRELITHAVEYDEMQRGIALIPKETVETFRTVWDVNGSQLRIFPEERHMFYRLAGGVLSVNKAHAEAGGLMGTGSLGEVALNAWISKIFKRFER